MKRILFIALLFVNLQIVMTEGGLSFISMTASAQTMMYEMLDDVEVNGELVNCKYGCGVRLCKREIEAHEESCPERMTECRTCHQSYKVSDGHDCMSKYVECPICRAQVRNEDFYNGRHTHNDPVTPPVTPSGGGNTGGSGEPVVGSYHPDNNGTTSIGNQKPFNV